jgi:hypothetical protein
MLLVMDWWGLLKDIVGGVVVTAIAAAFALLIAKNFTARNEEARASREHNLAAAAELYRVYGQFFAVWKAWDFLARSTGPERPLGDDRRRPELAEKAAAVEAGYESLLVRLAFEHALDIDERAALWCLRSAFKELRYAIRDNEVLAWWRSDIHGDSPGFREYQALKALLARVANIILVQPRNVTSKSPTPDQGTVLIEITGDGSIFTGNQRFASAWEAELEKRKAKKTPASPQWVVLAEQFSSAAAASAAVDDPAASRGPRRH